MTEYLFKTSLPFCLHLKDDSYEINYNGNTYVFKTYKRWTVFAKESDYKEEYKSEKNSKIQISFLTPVFSDSVNDFVEKFSGKNIEYIKDDTDHFRKTIIEIRWKSEKIFNTKDNEVDNLLSSELLPVINNFIEIYRVCSNEYFIPLLRDIPFRSFSSLLNLSTNEGQVLFKPLIQSASWNLEEKRHNMFETMLKDVNHLTSDVLSLNSAKYWFDNSQYRNSILETIIALEPIVQKAVYQLWKKRNISSRKIKEQFKKIDLNFMMIVEIPNILDLNNPKIKQHYDNVIDSINVRNKIVHQNLTNIKGIEAKQAIESTEFLINKLKNISSKEA